MSEYEVSELCPARKTIYFHLHLIYISLVGSFFVYIRAGNCNSDKVQETATETWYKQNLQKYCILRHSDLMKGSINFPSFNLKTS